MSRLFENYVEGMLLKNQELHDLARRNRDEYHRKSTVITRVMREILHEQVVFLEPDRDVMDMVYEHLSQSMEEIGKLPVQVICPPLPDTPLLLDFGNTRTIIPAVQEQIPPLAGMMFQCPGDRSVMRQARNRLDAKYHAVIQEVVARDQTTWTLSCLDEWGNEALVYLFQQDGEARIWRMTAGHQCPFGTCRYRGQGGLIQSCVKCESIKALCTLQLGLVLLYDSGYFQEVSVREEPEQRTYSVNSSGKTLSESETTREVRVRRIRKDVLYKELGAQKGVVHPRGSWLEMHTAEEVETVWKKREPFPRSTPSGKVIQVTPTEAKRIRRLKRDRPERTVVELVANQRHEQRDEMQREDG